VTFADLPTVNALLNGTAASLLVAGFFLIRAGRRDAHRRAMTAAFACSVLFLVSYLVYHFEAGSVRFQGTGTVRSVYFSILLTHTVLATAVPFLAVATLVLARKERFDAHRRLARVTLPIWLYVSVTGVVIYLMLYRMGF
jgi:putative membrane protein